MQQNFENVVPLIIPLDMAGAMLGASRATAYDLAKRGAIPVLPGPGRKRVPVGKLETLLGRKITIEDIAAAAQKLAPAKQRFLDYQREYREAKAQQ